jgi:hypothetical protein
MRGTIAKKKKEEKAPSKKHTYSHLVCILLLEDQKVKTENEWGNRESSSCGI